MSGIRVVVVEDNEDLCEEMDLQLQSAGSLVRTAPDGVALDALLAEERCDVLVLDLNLPGENGFSIARRLFDPPHLGIIMLTARDEIGDKTRGFADGADSYMVKPVDRRELAACIKALYRRVAPAEPRGVPWLLHAAARELVSPDGRRLNLSATDVTVLALLASEPGRTRSREEIVRLLAIDFMDTPQGRTNTVLSRLSHKLKQFDKELRVVSWRNQGYSFVGPSIQQVSRR